MSDKPFRWRTIVEVAAISIVIYIVLGAPGLKTPSHIESTSEQDVPIARARAESLVYPDWKDLKCSKHGVDMHIFSTQPLVIYIDGFLSGDEVEHLVDISEGKWQKSTVFNAGVETEDEAVRKSEKALIPRDDVVQCIEQRALSIQGWPKDTFIERLWTQRYNVSGHYSFHYDWSTATKEAMRVSTFMVYLKADCEGGGTNFPRLRMPDDPKWCRYIQCGKDAGGEGVTFKAKEGNAIFWMNFDSERRGYKEVIHAGMPVTKGTKIGLNIWSWYQKGHMAEL
ncbi:uncharacterized protein LTR77_008876 [Saxophila tyrrhenica]|uniref:Fe2OG dioxygenase domain-containing protein n=1 Tax=Saxophila tyrrhenica TaxID=1690608 RepID=A0AAV9P0X2_9PEZI|nr:hypothetical protein LTR77_008876 [Saxophila tyrrhenica]